MRIYAHAFEAANRCDERRAKLAALYGNGMETTERSGRKQSEAPAPANTPSLQSS